ncbi:hypothetical protein ACFW81_02550 [Streptomyces angustmyceticus]|uniref:hypothetical protein n=1 Tax=Streptomyces angustmyceticus TaxID=285578 RepID=UPI0036B61D91
MNTETPKVQITVAWPDRESTEWLLTYPRRGEYLVDESGELWEVAWVTQMPAPKAEFIVTVDKANDAAGDRSNCDACQRVHNHV